MQTIDDKILLELLNPRGLHLTHKKDNPTLIYIVDKNGRKFENVYYARRDQALINLHRYLKSKQDEYKKKKDSKISEEKKEVKKSK